jgi:hypothetical protein
MKYKRFLLLLLPALTMLLGSGGCGPKSPNSMGDLFMPTVYAAAGDTGSAAMSLGARTVLNRRTWVQAGQGAKKVGRNLANDFHDVCMLISCYMPDWQGENHNENYGETFGAAYGD